ncbi:MAG: hypothetical protein AUH94_06740 [Ktedonobacter sp. 13_2_20CM_2_54_8]|jgi:WD40 repeat protein|nr:MAG: hypothetical protein AUH94_06740 [Ktedonobacter sp. 13_2_20CM_2_54_8]
MKFTPVNINKNAATDNPLWMYCCHGWVNGIAWSPDGTRLASADDDGIVRIWQAPGACQCASDKKGQRL